MHEESLMRTLLRQVDHLARQHQAVSVDEIQVEVGPLSGVEPILLMSAFERLVVLTNFETARLVLREVPLECRCRMCFAEFVLENFRFICPQCGSGSVEILRGDSMRLLNVSMQIPDRQEAC